MSVVEPTICHYELRFETPLACPVDAFLGKIFVEMSATCHGTVLLNMLLQLAT